MEITIEERRPKKQKSFWFTNRSLERKRIEIPLRVRRRIHIQCHVVVLEWTLPALYIVNKGISKWYMYRNIILNFPSLKNVYAGDKNTLFRKKRFEINFFVRQNASKFAIFIEKENPLSFFRFSFRATLSSPLWMPWSMAT